MLSNYIMLLVSAILSFRDYDERTKYCPIRCTFDQIRTKRFGVSPIYTVQMVLLTVVFFWQLMMLYTNPKVWEARHDMLAKPRHKPDSDVDPEADLEERTMEEQTRNPFISGGNTARSRTRVGPYERWHNLHPGLRWVIVMLISPPSALVWLFIIAMWVLGLRRLLWDRQWAIGVENQWSFGQVLPILLIILPFFTVIEVFQESSMLEKLDRTKSYTQNTASVNGSEGGEAGG